MANKIIATENEESAYPKKVDFRLQQIMFNMEDALKVDSLAVTNLSNIRYLTNFSGSAAILFIGYDEIHFVTDDRYAEQVKTELYKLPKMKVHISRDPWSLIKEKKILKNINSMAFEADKIPYGEAVLTRNFLRPIKFKPATMPVETYTLPKSEEEIDSIQKSCRMSEKVIEIIMPMLKPGVSEYDIYAEIIYQSRKLGSEGDPFDIIVVSGERGALVHGSPSTRKFKKGDLVLMDFGCIVNGFISDLSRTFAVGKASKEQKQVYKLIIEAKEAAIAGVRPGMNGKHVDAFARDIIAKAGFGEYFQHSLGHGIGLVAHEQPILTFRRDDQIVPENCCLAIEPGIYLPDKFGIRVEDNIVVTKSGGKHLTTAPEELIVIE